MSGAFSYLTHFMEESYIALSESTTLHCHFANISCRCVIDDRWRYNSSQPLIHNMAATFVLVTDEEIGDLIDSADSANTKKQIQYAVNRLEAYAVFTGTSLAVVEALPDDELDMFLSLFFAGLCKADGSLYTKKSMHGIKYGLHCRFKTVKDMWT